MKIKKSIISILTAIMLIVLPQTVCFAQEESSTNPPVNAPNVTASDFTLDNSSIKPSDTFKFSFNLKNNSKTTDLKNVNLRFSGGEAFSISNDVDTASKDVIAKNSCASFSKAFYCSPAAETGMYPIGVTASYEYTAGGEVYQSSTEFSYTVKVTKPVASASSAAQATPVLTAKFSVSDSSVYPQDTFKLSLALKNTSINTDITNVNARFSGGDAFSLSKSSDTVYQKSIAKNSSAKISRNFICNKGVEAGMHPITVSLTYEYIQNGEKQQGSAEFTYSVETFKKASSKSKATLTPQLLISSFSYGGKEINGGQTFDLSFGVKNNSETTKIQNVIVKLSGGESFVVADGTDTITMKSLSANASANMSKSFKCLPSTPSGVYPITASVSYEYIENSAKQTATSELTMSIPVVQPDKVQFQSVDLADKTVTVGEEQDCAFSVVNIGQTKLSNGTVKLIDDKGNELSSAFIGNIEAGAQFTSNYTLPVTFDDTGDKKLALIFEYENENAEKKSIKQEFSLTVEEYFDPYEDTMTDDESTTDDTKKMSTPVIIGICAGGAVVIIVSAVVIKKIVKKKKAKKGSESFDEEI